MRNKRLISWSAAMRDLRQERTLRAGIREERLRATAGLRQQSPTLSSWRGRSGRRYVVGIHPLDPAHVLEITDAIILAVRRDRDGIAHVIDGAAAGPRPSEEARTRWTVQVVEKGATEMHVHRLAEDDADRRAVLDDLREDESA
ncbi:MAG TPA: hypothetical protein VGU45_13025 [Microvirga sp.]|jgi:hypothetical protein|nr:hypothetical protein [Microvirga sp.]